VTTASLQRTHVRTLTYAGLGVTALIIAVLIGAIVAARSVKPWVRNRIIVALKENYSSGLEIQSLDFSLIPSARITGRGLVLRQPGAVAAAGTPPLVAIDRFSAETGFRDLFAHPLRIRNVRLQGLQIHVQTGQRNAARQSTLSQNRSALVIDEVIADGTRLETIPDKASKQPLVWDIRKLTLRDTGPNRPMAFHATLINAKPPGEIHTDGAFGPWDREQPRLTPVSGSYNFREANLADFPGLSGMLSSDGRYTGMLERIQVEGNTDIPKFELRVSRNPVHLTTKFQALVDGTDGTTRLESVHARFGHSSLIARGIVDTTPGVPGNVISLDITVPHSRLEDILRLGVRGKPPLTGLASFHTKFLLAPGNKDISERLRLDGAFDVEQAKFANPQSQAKLDEMSRKTQGKKNSDVEEPVASDFKGHFQLRDGVMHFSGLSFEIPGVNIALDGTYGLANEALDFHGIARTKARLSQMTSGFKSILLKPIDPFFAKQGAGAVLHVQVTGTRESPQFGRDRHGK